MFEGYMQLGIGLFSYLFFLTSFTSFMTFIIVIFRHLLVSHEWLPDREHYSRQYWAQNFQKKPMAVLLTRHNLLEETSKWYRHEKKWKNQGYFQSFHLSIKTDRTICATSILSPLIMIEIELYNCAPFQTELPYCDRISQTTVVLSTCISYLPFCSEPIILFWNLSPVWYGPYLL